MRLPYVSDPPQVAPEDEPIVQRVRDRRGPGGLIPLDLALLHAPKIADGWNALLGAVRTQNSLPADIREIAICRVALINEAWFEWNAHLPILEESFFGRAKVEVLKQAHPTAKGPLQERQWAALRYADAMTRQVKVDDTLFHELRNSGLSDQQVVELTATVASYNMVSRFLVALDVGEQNGKVPDGITGA